MPTELWPGGLARRQSCGYFVEATVSFPALLGCCHTVDLVCMDSLTFSRDAETQSHWVSVWTQQVDIASNSSAPRALPWRQVRGRNKGEPRRERKKMSSDGGS